MSPQEDSPFDAAVDLDIDDEELLAANMEEPMIFEDGIHLASAELAQVDVAEKEFVQKARTLAAEADLEASKFGIECDNAQRKKAARIMDIVRSFLFDVYLTNGCSACEACFKSQVFEELETGLDLARNDQALDPVVRLGANRAIFILGKYYAKLDDCEIYPIALGECFSVFDFHIVTLCFAFSTGSKKNRQVDQEKQRMAI